MRQPDVRFVQLRGDVVAKIQGSLTLEEFVHRLGLDISAVRKALRGEPIRKSTARCIAQFGGVLYQRLIDGKETGREPGVPALPPEVEVRLTIPGVPWDKVLSRAEIEDLADRCGLFAPTLHNPHLAYKSGDISYWDAQREAAKRAARLWAEFFARGCVLKDAEARCLSVPTQGDLSHAAGPYVRVLLERSARLWPV